MSSSKYSSSYIRKNGSKYRLVVKYRQKNVGYIERSAADSKDRRTAEQKRRYVWRELSKTSNARTKSEANKELQLWIAELELKDQQAQQQEKLSTPLIEYIEQYIDSRETAQIIEASTARDYRHSKARLTKAFEGVTLQSLTAQQVQDYETAELRRGISTTTVGKVHRLLKQVLGHAVRYGDIDKNVMDMVEPPKRPRKAPNGIDIETAQMLTAMFLESKPTDLSTAAMLALHASLRVGEACGLRWSDVDLNSKRIFVRRAVAISDGGAYLKAPKNDSSLREVNITIDLTEKLIQRRDYMRSQLIDASVYMTEQQFNNLYVCGSIDGSFANPTSLTRKWSAIADDKGIVGTEGKRATFHTLRHGFATVGIASGVDVASVAAQMGHSTVSQTLNTYTSATAQGKLKAAQLMGDAMHPTGHKADVLALENTGTE